MKIQTNGNIFSAELTQEDINTEETMDKFSELMVKMQDEMVEYIKKIAEELNVSEECASDVIYLRSRSRHTKELEDRLIQLHKEGHPPNMCDFGHGEKDNE